MGNVLDKALETAKELTSRLLWPLPANKSYVSSGYKWRDCPFHGREFHCGVDLPAAAKTAIYAAHEGTATASYSSSYGNNVVIKGTNWSTRYCHMYELPFRGSKYVSKGQKIGKVGSTGNSTGNHLHFELHKGNYLSGGLNGPGNTVNPMKQSYIYTGYGTESRGGGFTTETTGGSGSGSGASGGFGSSGSSASSASAKQTVSVPLTTQNGTIATIEVAKKDITTVKIVSTDGTQSVQTRKADGVTDLNKGLEVFVQNGERIFKVCVEDGATLERPRKGSPSTFKFRMLKDGIVDFHEGTPVSVRLNGEKAFFGFVFTKSRKNNYEIEVTCYDQMRYLKNEETLSYSEKKYNEIVKLIADDFGLQCGDLTDTEFKMTRIEESSGLDILGNASDETVLNNGKLFVLYDDFGKLNLKNITDMKLPLFIDSETAQSFDYKSTIDNKTYTRVKMSVDDDTTGIRNAYVFNNTEAQEKWGVLQYYNQADENCTSSQIAEKARAILDYYSKKERNLKITGAYGDIRVRGGSSLIIGLDVGDMTIRNYMTVENVVHKFSNGMHTMDLTLSGIKGEFVS